MDIFILTAEKSKRIPPDIEASTIYHNPIHPPTGTKEYDWLSSNPRGAYQCFKGHQEIAKMITENSLVLEDDAVPVDPLWLALGNASKASDLLNEYEVVSLHSRFPQRGDYACMLPVPYQNPWNPKQQWTGKVAYGSLAYLITPEAARKLVGIEWTGVPIDLVLCNEFRFATILPSGWKHDTSEASLVRNFSQQKI